MTASAANPTPAILLIAVTLLFMVTWQNDHGLAHGGRTVSRCVCGNAAVALATTVEAHEASLVSLTLTTTPPVRPAQVAVSMASDNPPVAAVGLASTRRITGSGVLFALLAGIGFVAFPLLAGGWRPGRCEWIVPPRD